jgi:NAD(P)-dependent dehydrogenase (short-subunit alcohol dehydrogenase family)
MRTVGGGCVAITGAASGIGRATAVRLAAEGCPLGLIDIDEAELVALSQELPGSVACPLDVRDEPALAEALTDIARARGPLTGLVTSAGIAGAISPVEELRGIEELLAVNFVGTANAVKHAVPLIRQAGGGAIVCVASAAAFVGTPKLAAYAASKAAIIAFAKCAAVELASDHIRVNTVCPGIVDTPMVGSVSRQRGGSPHVQGAPDNVVGRMASPSEIADAINYLLSANASFVVGTDLIVDGGKLAR